MWILPQTLQWGIQPLPITLISTLWDLELSNQPGSGFVSYRSVNDKFMWCEALKLKYFVMEYRKLTCIRRLYSFKYKVSMPTCLMKRQNTNTHTYGLSLSFSPFLIFMCMHTQKSKTKQCAKLYTQTILLLHKKEKNNWKEKKCV